MNDRDIAERASAVDFWPRVDTLRQRCPVVRRIAHGSAEDSGFWMLSTYQDVMDAAVNHDSGKLPDPETLNFERPNGSAHVAFGAGIHCCLGNHLARRELKAAVPAISELRVFELEPGSDVKYRAAFARGPVSLPIRLER